MPRRRRQPEVKPEPRRPKRIKVDKVTQTPAVIPEPESSQLAVLPFATQVSLDLPADTTFERWATIATYMKAMEGGLRWWSGDLMKFAEDHGKEYAEHAYQKVSELHYAENTLKNALYVCRRFPKERRRPDLTFAHHETVAYMQSKQAADRLLEEAAEKHWTITELKEARREYEAKHVGRRGKELPPVPVNPLHAPTHETASDVAHLCQCPVCGNEHQSKT